MTRPFVKMNGLGNDFVIVHAGRTPFVPSAAEARAIADRRSGIGCDQLIVLAPAAGADASMRVWNADGGEAGACGNGTRCAGWLLMEASSADRAEIVTQAGRLVVERAAGGQVTADLGAPGLDWRDIPLAREMDTREITLRVENGLAAPGCVSMGNPHTVFFVKDAEAAPALRVGPVVEHDPLFPERCNVGFAQVKARDRIRLRVWERGAGLTRACGTGAAAALVAARRRGLTGRAATVEMDGGELEVFWRHADGHVLLTGPVAVEFTGVLPALEVAG
jgi:diaminopimelate epimerase